MSGQFILNPSRLQFELASIDGNRYYAGYNGGEYLGCHGSERMLYVLEPPLLYEARDGILYDPAAVILNSVPIGRASLAAQSTVIRYIAYHEVGVRRSLPVGMGVLSDPTNYGRTQTIPVRNPGDRRPHLVSRNMVIHPYSDNMKRSQYYDIFLNLVHEKHHADTPGDARDHDKSEYEANLAVINHHYFQYASQAYRDYVRRNFNIFEARMQARRWRR